MGVKKKLHLRHLILYELELIVNLKELLRDYIINLYCIRERSYLL